MGELGTASKIVMVLGVVLLLSNLLTGASLSEWNNLRNVLESGVTFPTFTDPFTPSESSYPALPDAQRLIETPVPTAFVGCSNTSEGSNECLVTNDGDSSYARFFQVPTPPVGHGFRMNWSQAEYRVLLIPTVRRVELTAVCRTESENTTAARFNLFWDLRPDDLEEAVLRFDCPLDTYTTTRVIKNYPTGPVCTGPCLTNSPFSSGVFDIFINQTDAVGNPVGRVTFLQLNVFLAGGDTDCTAPEGAWFPTLDDLACAVIGFANLVWKGIVWAVNAGTYVILSIVAIVGFMVNVAFAFFVALIASFGAIFNLGAPSPVQEIIDIAVIGMLVFLTFLFVMIIRGSGPV